MALSRRRGWEKVLAMPLCPALIRAGFCCRGQRWRGAGRSLSCAHPAAPGRAGDATGQVRPHSGLPGNAAKRL